jgi:hypothetical protein
MPHAPSDPGRAPQPRRRGVAAAVADILRRAGGPLSLDAIAAELAGEGWARSPGWEDRLRGALAGNDEICRAGRKTYDLVGRRLAGARLLHTLTAAEVRHGVLLGLPDLDGLLARGTGPDGEGADLALVDASGAEWQARLAAVRGPEPARANLPLGLGTRIYQLVTGLQDWLRAEGAAEGDEVCFQPLPPDARRFAVALEHPPAARGVDEADAALAEAALTILRAARGTAFPEALLQRVAGQVELRGGAPVHLPVFVLGRDPRFLFDGFRYGLAGVATAGLPPYPLPEEYPENWTERDPLAELVEHVRLAFGGLFETSPIADEVLRRRLDVPGALVDGLRAQRPAGWELLQDRSRLLNPGGGRPGRGGKVIRGPWPG